MGGKAVIMEEKCTAELCLKVGQRIHKYRTAKRLTQEQVAEKVGISQKHLSRIEQGYHNPRFDMIIKIADTLNISADALAKDMKDGSVGAFFESIRENAEKLTQPQKKFIKEIIKLTAETKF